MLLLLVLHEKLLHAQSCYAGFHSSIPHESCLLQKNTLQPHPAEKIKC